jgi:hypothetical protein
MTHPLSATDCERLNRLDAEARYDYLLQRVEELGQLWSLANGDEWVVMRSGDDECLPLWPDAELARCYACEDWADCQPRAISLETFLARWIKGLERDGTLLAIFPSLDDEGLVLSPAEFSEALSDLA